MHRRRARRHAERVGRSAVAALDLFETDVILDHRAAPERVGVDVDGDDEIGAERAGHGDRDRVDQRPVEQPAPAGANRLENAGQGVGGADRLDQIAARQPHLVPCADLGRHRGEAHRQGFDAQARELLGELGLEPSPAEQAGAGEGQIEQAEYAALRQGEGEGFDLGEFSGGVGAADDGADGAADDDVGPQPLPVEFVEHADMGPAARRARAERQADCRFARRPHAAAPAALVIGLPQERECHGRSPSAAPQRSAFTLRGES